MRKNFFTILWFVFAVIAGVVLYNTSDDVHHINKNIRSTKAGINDEQHTIAVLQAEFSSLTTPSRLGRLSKKYLPDLAPITGKQITSYKDYFLMEGLTKAKEKTRKKTKAKIRVKKLTNIADLIERTLANDKVNISSKHKTSAAIKR